MRPVFCSGLILLPRFALERPEKDKQDNTFKQCLVELRRVSGQGTAAGKDHAPGNVRCPAVQLGIHKVANPPQSQANGNRDHIDIRNLPEINLMSLAV